MATADRTQMGLLLRSRVGGYAKQLTTMIARIPVPLMIVLGIAIVLRCVAWLAVTPAMMNNVDTTPYVTMADLALFADPARTTGYSLFLRGVHVVSSQLELTILVQHLLGLLTGALLYATVRRIGAPVWAAVASAAAILLSLDQVYLEHTLLSESVFTFVLVVVLYAAVRALDPARDLVWRVTTRHAWIAAAGVSLGLATWMRGVAAPLVPLFAIWVALAKPGQWRPRIARGALAAAAAAAMLLVYAQQNSELAGHFGLTKTSGWGFYSRVAPFADCSEFTPPEGTAELCEDTPPSDRSGSDFYGWNPESPAQQFYGYPPAGNDQLGAFARETIVNQPLNYVLVVVRDTTRYFAPDIDFEVPAGGTPYNWMSFDRRDDNESDIERNVSNYYPGEELNIDETAASTLADFQAVLRLHPPLLLVSAILGAFGIWFARGRTRAGLVLLLGTAMLLILIPSATAGFNARYVIPADGPFVAAGAIGLWVLLQRFLERHRSDSPAEGAATT